MDELAFLSATELAGKIRSRDISCVELLQYYLDRVDRFNGALNAIVFDMREQALAEAAAADVALARDESIGPLHGVPMTVKESYKIAGTPATWGNPAWADILADEDAESIKKLKNAGAIIFGKTNVPLSLADFQSYNDVYGTTNNPYDHSRIPGGSSGGSAAALAAGLTGLETGSDIAGSIRNPAHFCGIFGHKPTHNLVWMRGHAAPGDIRSDSDISVIGPMARSAKDLDTAVRVMAGPGAIMSRGYHLNLPEWGQRQLSELKVGVWGNDPVAPVSQEVAGRVDNVIQALRDAGAHVDEAARPNFTGQESHAIFQTLLHSTMAARQSDENYQSLLKYVATLEADDNSEKATVFRAQVASFKEWRQANEKRQHLRWAWHTFFSEYDVLISPVMPTAAFEHDHSPFGDRTIMVDNLPRPYFEQTFWAGLTGVSFLPSTVVPTGLNASGLPIGIQIVGPEYADLITIGVAHELERLGFAFSPPEAYS